MGTVLPLSGNLTTSDIVEYWGNLFKPEWAKATKSNGQGKVVIISTSVRDIQPEWISEYNCVFNYNNKLSDEFFQFDTIKLNQNN